MRKPLTVALLLVVPLVLLGFAGASQAQLVLYDNFNAKPINPAKWFGTEFQFGPANPDTEAVRKLAGGKLSISLTEWGRTDSDSGQGGGANFALSVTNPAPVTTFQAEVTLKTAKVVGCAANTSSSKSAARILGSYFNDGTGSGPGDETGDILAFILSARDSLAGDQILAGINRCGSPNCTSATTLASVVFTASWVQGVAKTMSVQWDKPNKQFIFTLNPGGSQEQHILTYSVSDANPPGINLRQLAARTAAASCMSGPRTHATTTALFDNVMVNP